MAILWRFQVRNIIAYNITESVEAPVGQWNMKKLTAIYSALASIPFKREQIELGMSTVLIERKGNADLKAILDWLGENIFLITSRFNFHQLCIFHMKNFQLDSQIKIITIMKAKVNS